MKPFVMGIACAALAASLSVLPAQARTTKQTTITTGSFYLDGTAYTLSGPATLVDAGDYVLIELTGANLPLQSDPTRAQFLSFSLSVPKGNPGQLLSGGR
jgi:hypothetical protein